MWKFIWQPSRYNYFKSSSKNYNCLANCIIKLYQPDIGYQQKKKKKTRSLNKSVNTFTRRFYTCLRVRKGSAVV